MKTLITLSGPGHRGKSATLKLVYDLLRTRHPAAPQYFLKHGADIRVVLEIGSIKVGIETQGDPNSRLPKSLDLFEREGCAAIICAARTSGMTIDAVNCLSGAYRVIRYDQIAKQQPTEQAARNLQMANKIVEQVEEVIASSSRRIGVETGVAVGPAA